MTEDFLDGIGARKGRWQDVTAGEKGISAHFYWLGRGQNGLEVAFATAERQPNRSAVHELWKRRQGNGVAPLFLVIEYGRGSARRALVCGPAGDNPPAVDLELDHADRLARAALEEPSRHLAIRFLAGALEGTSEEQPGLRNKGLLATHELLHGVPERRDWEEAKRRSEPLLKERGKELVQGLGFEIESHGRHSVLRSRDGRAEALALFLEESEQADQSSPRFENQTPVTYALTHADRDNLSWVVAVRGGAIRLYSTTTSGSVGQRGRAETFVELNLPLLPSEQAGYLDLLFSAKALAEGGQVEEIRRASSLYTSALSARLRERVYQEVVPRLAIAVAERSGKTTEEDLEHHYRAALTILFRLLFIAYAEDSRLLPLHANGDYTDHALKTAALRLSETINAGRDLGFDNPLTAEIEAGTDDQNDLWEGARALFHAVDRGHRRWGVPAYNGGLFSSEPAINPVGETIEGLDLTNAEFGPALTALIVDRSPDGTIGPIDFRSLSVREFGTIYEGLLESELSVANQPLALDREGIYVPANEGRDVVVEEGGIYLHNQSGARKSSGSYFTKPFAVDHLIEHSVDSALDEHLARVEALLADDKHADAAESLFDFRVADIAMGSGHFLTAVVDRLEARYTAFLADHPIPEVSAELDSLRRSASAALGDLADTVELETSSLLRRLIARRCIYGVDVNPLSVELARVAMWIHTFVPGLPLSFLDHNLAVGDSLAGIGTIGEATGELVGSDSQASLFDEHIEEALRAAEEPLRRLGNIADATVEDVKKAREASEEAERAVEQVAGLFDLLVAARTGEATLPTILSADDLFGLDTSRASQVVEEMEALHFPVAFPEVFLRERPGFDVLVGNPPWDKVKVEEHEFWGRHFPGFRGLPQREKESRRGEYSASRPDLVEALEAEKASAARLKSIVGAGPYALGSGDTELSRVFAWRFWHLLREKGRFGVVLPRQAILSAPGMAAWRRKIIQDGSFADTCLLTNNRKWVFEDIHPQYTVALTTVYRSATKKSVVRLDGPYRSHADYAASQGRMSSEVSGEEFAEWSADVSFPAFRSPKDIPVYRKMMRHPRFGDNRNDWKFRPLTETHATGDKHLFTFADEQPKGMWPIYSGASFNLWSPETGQIYAWTDPDQISDHLYEKQRRQAKKSRSAFSELPADTVANKKALPCLSPRIAFRDIARATDQRTVIAALIPPYTVPQHTAPFLLRADGSEHDEAYLLGVLSSRIFDWCARRQVETHLTFTVVNGLPIPELDADDSLCERVVEISGRLAAVDERYREWAEAVGVEVGSVGAEQKPSLLTELDAAVALLYGLTEEDLGVLYSTFHYGWDHKPYLAEVLEHHRRLSRETAGVSR